MDNSRFPLVEPARRIPATTWWCIACTVLALGLRLYGVSQESLWGDEFSSLHEAQDLGLNLNSIAYSVFMHWWIKFGTSELILRLPSVLIGTATVPVMCALGRASAGPRAGIVAALLTALSAFGIAHSQEVRFYSFFPFAAALAIFLTIRLAEGKNTRQDKILLVFSYLLVVLSHFLGILVAIGCIATLVVARFEKKKRGYLLVMIALLFVGSLMLLMAPPVHQWVSRFYAEHANTTGSSPPPISGLSMINLVKTAAALYFFTLGYSVYPLWLWVVIPALLLFATLAWFGMRRLITTNAPLLIFVFCTAAFLGTYFVLDPIGGGWASGVSPRHVAFYWPVFLLVVSIGLDSLKRLFRPALLAVVVLSFVCLACRWDGSWNYGGKTDWRSAVAYFNQYEIPRTVLIYDGRSHDALEYYYHGEPAQLNAWTVTGASSQELLTSAERVFFLSSDYQAENRLFLSGALRSLQRDFAIRYVRVRYPVFQYVLDRRSGRTPGTATDTRILRIDLPLEIHDLRFQEVPLPVQFKFLGVQHEIVGMTGLPTIDGRDSLSILLRNERKADGIFVFSNCTNIPTSEDSRPIAEFSVTSTSGATSTHLLRYGVETGDWLDERMPAADNRSMLTESSEVVLSWGKRIHMVGQKSYPGAWRTGRGKIYGTFFRFEGPIVPREILLTSRISGTGGKINIWGISLRESESDSVSFTDNVVLK